MKQLKYYRFRIAYNPHFVAIIAIIFILALFYYGRNLYIADGFPWFDRVKIFDFLYNMHGSLFIIPFIYSVIVFKWRGVLVTWLTSIILISPRMVYLSPDVTSLIQNTLFALAPFGVYMFFTLELKWREKERESLAEREAERKTHMAQIFNAQEDERRHISQELHDDTIQTLSVIAYRAQELLSDGYGETKPKVMENAAWIRDTTLRLTDDLRRLSLDLRPGILDEMGLVPALRWLVDRLKQEDGIDTRILVRGTVQRLTPETETVIFRIAQESLSNIRRHAEATKVTVTFVFGEKTLKLTVQDNGEGFPVPKIDSGLTAKGKFGLIGMKEKVEFLGGVFNIDSEPGKGTSVSLEVSHHAI